MLIIDIQCQPVREIFFEKTQPLEFRFLFAPLDHNISCNQLLSFLHKRIFDFMQHYFFSGNASCTIAENLISSFTFSTSLLQVVGLHAQLIEASNEISFQLMTEIQNKIETIQFSSNNNTVINKKTHSQTSLFQYCNN